ncbi:protein-glutamate methylesterase/protein-glutamine glutaminase [Dethiobacter alkaliphilus]|uniref:protein-glutamate methylesterase/protein-glutamine glutaminase n=1 Tax=Dethiobacter alkaliphilus TaxID=427926 RepID=UPI00222684EC|nr:chemotaxis response regulator protein-glutamate methylesterase [Dethiobacter alkaliphilus]MCW3488710.1 chemotaxis response regulator protein-glutamate methylesterase [Dethiobacter alkaliphilus]
MEPVKVLVVDDSALMRRIVKDIFNADPRFQVVAIARDGVDALEKIIKFQPGLVTLDVEMPRLNGLETLKEIVRRFDIPVIMLSSLTQQGSQVTVEALSIGAVDFITKPELHHGNVKETLKEQLLTKAAVAAQVKVQSGPVPVLPPKLVPQKPAVRSAAKVVAIGASTGGPRALEAVLLSLPQNLPAAVLVTQHMPPKFTKALADRLNKAAAIRVKEAEEGEPILAGVAYIAPGNFHLEVASDHTVRLTQDPPVQHVRPSATVMMLSAAAVYGKQMVGVILTGMGKDGADGMVEIKRQGGSVLAQDETTSAIFSMPRAAIQAGAADQVLPLEKIAAAITALCGR